MDFIVVGAGIGGLSCANALAREGHNVRVLERTSELRPVGAGISLQPNAMQAIRRFDLFDEVSAVSWSANNAQVLSSVGKVFTEFDFTGYESRFQTLPLTVFRGDLVRVLAEGLGNRRGDTTIELNQEFDSFEESDDRILVRTKSGAEYSGEVLIAADGIHSIVRNQLWGEQSIRYSGYTCWRGIVDEPSLVSQVSKMTEVWGKGTRCGFMRCNESQVYWFATEDRKQRSDHLKDTEWKSRFQNWVDPIPKLINTTPDESIVHTDLIDLKPMSAWSRGRVTLLGDAAHAMTPNFGQGGAQAIEDAVCLALVLKNAGDLPSALRMYESLRIPRTTSIVKGAWSYGKIAQGGNWFRRFLRNQVMTRLPKSFIDKQLAQQLDFDGWLSQNLSRIHA